MGRSGSSGEEKAAALFASADQNLWKNAIEQYETAIISANDAVTQHIDQCLNGIVDERPSFYELDCWYRVNLPASIKSREPPYISKEELLKVLAWKLARCTWRGNGLVNGAKSNPEELIMSLSTEAFSKKEDIAIANRTLDEGFGKKGDKNIGLRSVGPALASAIMSIVDETGNTPFMSDEAMYGAGIPLKYRRTDYMKLVEKLQQKATDLGPDWSASRVERALFAAAMQNVYEPGKNIKNLKPKRKIIDGGKSSKKKVKITK